MEKTTSGVKTDTPAVSIVVISYNQDKYIQQALDSFVDQKTDFIFEIIIADDCSTDNTARIIAEYAERFPSIVKPVLRKRNIGIQANLVDALTRASGEYIALCEGDDYWTDPSKLQRQYDFLANNKDYSVCFHPVRVLHEGNDENREDIYPVLSENFKISLEHLLKENFIQTNSVMYRRRGGYDDIPLDILPLDWYLHLYHAKNGKIGLVNEVMSVYRRHPGGVWWESDKDLDKIWQRYGLSHLELYIAILKLFNDNPDYVEIMHEHILRLCRLLVEVDERYSDDLLVRAIDRHSDVAATVISDQYSQIKKQELLSEGYRRDVNQMREKISRQHDMITEYKGELKLIKSSKFWKIRNMVARLVGKTVI